MMSSGDFFGFSEQNRKVRRPNHRLPARSSLPVTCVFRQRTTSAVARETCCLARLDHGFLRQLLARVSPPLPGAQRIRDTMVSLGAACDAVLVFSRVSVCLALQRKLPEERTTDDIKSLATALNHLRQDSGSFVGIADLSGLLQVLPDAAEPH
jgi:hypothetical protein